MKYFIDTEFDQEDVAQPVELISIGIVAEDGREFYAVSLAAFNKSGTWSPWLRENVLPSLMSYRYARPEPLSSIRSRVEAFLQGDEQIEFWGYYADYDWFLFTRLWGFMNMPRAMPKLCYDVKQLAEHDGVRDLPAELNPKHNAFFDACWIKAAYEHVISSQKKEVTLPQISKTDIEKLFATNPSFPRSGDVFKHFKGSFYRVDDVYLHSDTGEPVVAYRQIVGDYQPKSGIFDVNPVGFVRPLSEFLSEVEVKAPRFKKIL